MKVRFLVVPIALVLCLTASRALRRGSAATAADAGTSASEVAALLRSDRIARLDVFYFPKEMETLTALRPESLERQAWYRVGVEQFQWSAMRTALIDALDSSSFAPAAGHADCSWGCVFYDGRNVRVLTMYFDGAGRLGLINGESVTGASQVVDVLEARCSQLWRGEVRYHPLAR
jgi:hypothetical protein